MGNDKDESWIPERESAFIAGANSGVDPDLVQNGQYAWAKNMTTRGGKLKTRPRLIERAVLPGGRVQGLEYFSQGAGSLMCSISGYIYNIEPALNTVELSLLEAPTERSSFIPEVFMQETSGFMVIQDGSEKALIFNGSSLRSAEPDEVPRGLMMAYGNGRLWVALLNGRVKAGNIVDGEVSGSELKFTETQYLGGGGSLSMPGDVTGMKFVPSNDLASGFGPLIVFGKSFTVALRADISDRASWSTAAGGFQAELFPEIGSAGHTCISTVNQDLYWRDGNAGVRGLKQSSADYESAGSSPISNEISRLTNFESDSILTTQPSSYFSNRLIMGASPYFPITPGVTEGNITAFKDMAVMDFTQLSNRQGKSPPVWEGEWDGISITHSKRMIHEGKERMFFISRDVEGVNRLWELDSQGRDDVSLSLTGLEVPSQIEQEAELKRMFFGDPATFKRLERFDIWLSDFDNLEISLYYRKDQDVQWKLWETRNVAVELDNDGTEMKELRPGYVSRLKSFTPPTDDFLTGGEFQFKLRLKGRCQIDKIVAYASLLDTRVYAELDVTEESTEENEIELEELFYEIPVFNPVPGDYVDESGDQYVDENGDEYFG